VTGTRHCIGKNRQSRVSFVDVRVTFVLRIQYKMLRIQYNSISFVAVSYHEINQGLYRESY
jgi:hypothetical protein